MKELIGDEWAGKIDLVVCNCENHRQMVGLEEEPDAIMPKYLYLGYKPAEWYPVEGEHSIELDLQDNRTAFVNIPWGTSIHKIKPLEVSEEAAPSRTKRFLAI